MKKAFDNFFFYNNSDYNTINEEKNCMIINKII